MIVKQNFKIFFERVKSFRILQWLITLRNSMLFMHNNSEKHIIDQENIYVYYFTVKMHPGNRQQEKNIGDKLFFHLLINIPSYN